MRGFKKDITFEQLIIISLFLYLGFIYFSIAVSNIALGISIILFIIGLFLKNIKLDFKGSRVKIFLLILIPFLLTIFSVIHSYDLSKAINFVQLRIPILIVSFMLTFMKLSMFKIKKGVFIYLILTVFAVIYVLFKVFVLLGEGIILKPDFIFFITPIQHSYFGIYLLIALVSLIEFKPIENKFIRNIIFVLLIAGNIISTSRLAYILMFLIFVFYIFQYLSLKKSFLIFISLGLFSIIFITINSNINLKFKNTLIYHNSPRLKLWNNAIKIINNSNSRLLGIGNGDYYHLKKDSYFFKEKESGQYGYDPHSQLFDFYITTGYLGVIILLFTVFIEIYLITKQNNYARIIFFIILMFSLTESILNRQYGIQLYSIFIPLILRENFK